MNRERAFKIAARAIKELPEEVMQGHQTMSNIGQDLLTVLQAWGNRLEGHTSASYILTPKELKLIVNIKKRIEQLHQDAKNWKVDTRLYNKLDIRMQNKIKQDIDELNNAIVDVSIEINEYISAVDAALAELRQDLAGIEKATHPLYEKSIKKIEDVDFTPELDKPEKGYLEEHFPEVSKNVLDMQEKIHLVYEDRYVDQITGPLIQMRDNRNNVIDKRIEFIEKSLGELNDIWNLAQRQLTDKSRTLQKEYKKGDDPEAHGKKIVNLKNQYVYLGTLHVQYKNALEKTLEELKKEKVL